MDRSTAIRASFAAEDESPLAVIQAKGKRNDLTLTQEDDSLGALANPRRTRLEIPMPRPPPGPAPQRRGRRAPSVRIEEEGEGGDEEDEEEDESSDSDGFVDPFTQTVDDDMVASAERIRAEKMDLINRLHRFAQSGVDVPAHLSIKTPIDELRAEFGK